MLDTVVDKPEVLLRKIQQMEILADFKYLKKENGDGSKESVS